MKKLFFPLNFKETKIYFAITIKDCNEVAQSNISYFKPRKIHCFNTFFINKQ